MAKLIPGKIRTEGIALVENNKVVILEVSDSLLYARVDECNLRYSLDDDVIFCYCDFFQKKKYCAHLAALEYYLKKCPIWKRCAKEYGRRGVDQSGDPRAGFFWKLVLG